MTDPFYLDKSYYDAHPDAPAGEKKVYGSEGFSPEDITGADYIILNHVHADHCNLVGMLWEKFKGRVLVPGPCALELAKTFRIPTQAIYPIFPGEYTGALKAPVRCFGNHLSGKGKSSFQTDNECSGAAILKK